ncbi:hypothetical protein LUZ62_086830 [Rhynchospora pubera]|uniref:Uncharacterized protein n=1 Tax=Rhynchospora pubera TaxID=906938 RepID=A0AAV8CAQ2_9POAL|nr:hypothetical protein LUZ62_086830 [Rhynchospora pubera]
MVLDMNRGEYLTGWKLIDEEGPNGEGRALAFDMERARLLHQHWLGESQCTSALVKHINAPLDAVWSMVRSFDELQRYKPFVKQSVMREGLEVRGIREIEVASGFPKVYLASGGNDKLLPIWDISKCSPLHRLNNHTAAVRALAWCPFQNNLLASGGGKANKCIKFWNVSAGTYLKSVNTGSQICGLLWSKSDWELVSSHGLTKNQLVLWKYSSMSKMAELTGHASPVLPVLYLAQSPDRCTVASVSGDEKLKIWRIFEKSTI